MSDTSSVYSKDSSSSKASVSSTTSPATSTSSSSSSVSSTTIREHVKDDGERQSLERVLFQIVTALKSGAVAIGEDHGQVYARAVICDALASGAVKELFIEFEQGANQQTWLMDALGIKDTSDTKRDKISYLKDLIDQNVTRRFIRQNDIPLSQIAAMADKYQIAYCFWDISFTPADERIMDKEFDKSEGDIREIMNLKLRNHNILRYYKYQFDRNNPHGRPGALILTGGKHLELGNGSIQRICHIKDENVLHIYKDKSKKPAQRWTQQAQTSTASKGSGDGDDGYWDFKGL